MFISFKEMGVRKSDITVKTGSVDYTNGSKLYRTITVTNHNPVICYKNIGILYCSYDIDLLQDSGIYTSFTVSKDKAIKVLRDRMNVVESELLREILKGLDY